ncbi:hypothetical protein ACH6EH_06665 [Paenibacillus sp. JSM ZJ436]|uniref:hypothetical protein n=1 Tax=Paenibacillus sp. JSM ZJ436 TaxID=3376190 RepID=UPI00379EE5A4
MDKKSQFNLVVNSVTENIDPTLLNVTFVVHDFELSGNGQVITKEIALENAHTLLNKPLVCKYYPALNGNSSTDALGTHEQFIGVDRYGNDDLQMDTIPVGVITTEGYVLDIEGTEVLAVDGVLWRDRFEDVCGLLLEWYQRGVKIISSVEYYYKNYTHKDGVEYIESPILYSGHCLLNSEQRGDHKIVTPAYESSHLLSFNDLKQFNKLVAQALNQSSKEGVGMFKKVCELSHDDIRSQLYGALNDALSDEEYYDSWIVEVFDNRFIYHTWVQDVGTKFYEVAYTKTESEDKVNVDFANKVEVIEERSWTKANINADIQQQLNESIEKIEALNSDLTSSNQKLETISQEKESLLTQFNDASEKLVSMNQLVEELQPYKEQVESEKLQQAINEQTEFYSAKFNAVNAADKFASDEVQELIKLSINEDETGKDAKLQLNSILVEMVQPILNEEPQFLVSANSRGRLIDKPDTFESRYSIN